MRYSKPQLLKNLRFYSHVKEIGNADILDWANRKVNSSGRTGQLVSFKDKNISTGIFFFELLSSVVPRVVNWNLLTKGKDFRVFHLGGSGAPYDAGPMGSSRMVPERGTTGTDRRD
ncbi:hypothetical protein MLD38_002930 [Melastoma candidum]|uniref:Uncharacterized protein n=1 Tax=Melastoma candidum TaxID=119954 RepID=A0ACB9S5D0_9MYRT|nr:hypothetical protein MLD38_002930 [Melastoma candidum]